MCNNQKLILQINLNIVSSHLFETEACENVGNKLQVPLFSGISFLTKGWSVLHRLTCQQNDPTKLCIALNCIDVLRFGHLSAARKRERCDKTSVTLAHWCPPAPGPSSKQRASAIFVCAAFLSHKALLKACTITTYIIRQRSRQSGGPLSLLWSRQGQLCYGVDKRRLRVYISAFDPIRAKHRQTCGGPPRKRV